MWCDRGCRASWTPSARAATRATPSRAASPPVPRRRRRSLPGTSSSGFLSVEGGRPGCPVLAELEHGLLAWVQLADLAAGSDPDRTARAFGVNGQRQAVAGKRHLNRGLPELHRERQAIELARQPRIEVQDAVADEGSRVTALHEVERPGHYTHVDAFLGRAALNVVGIAVQRDQEPLPRAFRVDGGQDPGMGDK